MKRLFASISALGLAGCVGTADRGAAEPVLAGTSWRLVEIRSMDDAQGVTRPDDPSRYSLSFAADGRASMRLDCNRGMGPWRATAAGGGSGTIEIGPLATIKALCPPPSLADRLEANMAAVRGYLFKDDRLHLSMMADAGVLVWERAADAN